MIIYLCLSMRPDHFFKYYNAHVAKLVLSSQKVRWNSPLNFNDPFDCYFSIEPKFDIAKVSQKHRERFLDLMSQESEPSFEPSNSFVPFLTGLRKVVKGASREKLRDLLGSVSDEYAPGFEALCTSQREIWKKEMAAYRLFCVCETKDNLLLWATYAANHTGVAFQFDCIVELDVPLLVAKPVTYSNEAPGMATEEEWLDSILGLRPLAEGAEVWERLVTTKAKAWEHEKEWRVITRKRHYENQGYEDTEFCPQEISKVFFGCRISKVDRTALLALLDGSFSHAEVYQTRQHPKLFQLEFDRIK